MGAYLAFSVVAFEKLIVAEVCMLVKVDIVLA